MKPPKLLSRLHARLGDFWWYSLMLFCACRAADAMNMFVALWLVPKYVGQKELGALMPLMSFANFLVLPVSVFATTFTKETTTLAANGEYGRMKSLIRGAFVSAGVFTVLALVISHFVLPAFFVRIRVAAGSLGILILASSLTAAVTPVYQSALQALKRFKSISVMNMFSAPVRFLTMAVAMPFRAISGYFFGLTATSVFTISASVFALRRELSVPAEPYWTRPVFRRFALVSAGIAAYCGCSAILTIAEQTALRQRIPEVESAAYYMVTRFSEIAGYVSCTLATVLFPFTASLAAESRPTRPLVVKSSLAMLAVGGALAGVFAITGRPLMSILPNGESYADYAWAIPWMIGITTIASIQTFHVSTEVSAGRFGFLKWWVPLNLAFAAGLMLVTGYGYFTACFPAQCTEFLSKHNFTSLAAMLWWFTATTAVKTAICVFALLRQGGKPTAEQPSVRIPA